MQGRSEIMKEKRHIRLSAVEVNTHSKVLPMVTKQSVPNLLQVHDATKLLFKGMPHI